MVIMAYSTPLILKTLTTGTGSSETGGVAKLGIGAGGSASGGRVRKGGGTGCLASSVSTLGNGSRTAGGMIYSFNLISL